MGEKGIKPIAGGTSNYGGTPLLAIRNRFAEGYVLFGGVICVGSLEDQVYQDMIDPNTNSGGFGVVPVPLYRTSYKDKEGNDQTDNYLTQIHNIGRIGAIAAKCEKFAQCTAYLNYLSLKSTDILNEYYDYKLKYDVAGGSDESADGNAEMLDYIRFNVRTAFDKVFEDAIGKAFSSIDSESNENKWHNMILGENLQCGRDTMVTKYRGCIGTKAKYLEGLLDGYDALPGGAGFSGD